MRVFLWVPSVFALFPIFCALSLVGSRPAQATLYQSVIHESHLTKADLNSLETKRRCFGYLVDLKEMTDADLLNDCMEYFSHHPDYDPGFRTTIAIRARIIEIDPYDTYSRVEQAGYFYSRWVAWHWKYPGWTENDKLGDTRAVRLLIDGESFPNNADDPEYFLKCAESMAPFAKSYRPGLFGFVRGELSRAERIASSDLVNAEHRGDEKSAAPLRLLLAKIYLETGNVYRVQKQKEDAIIWFRKAAAMEPDPTQPTYRSATNYLKAYDKPAT